MDYKKILIDTMMSSKYKGKTLEELKAMFDLSNAQEFISFMKEYNEGIEDLTFIEIKDKIYLASREGYFKGILKVHPKGFGFVENDEFHCYVADVGKMMNGDEVFAQFIHKEN